MRYRWQTVLSLIAAVGTLTACGSAGDARALDAIAPASLDARIRFLSSDLLAGRGTGRAGGRLAAGYIANQFQLAGLAPAVGDSSYFQPVPLLRVTPSATLALRAAGGARLELRADSDYVARSAAPLDTARVNAELVFVGYGITAPEWGWDDYGGEDLGGKVALMLSSDPGEAMPGRFRGDTLTRYGDPASKFEQARRHGAVGALIIHSPESTGYTWDAVRAPWTGDWMAPRGAVDSTALRLEGWLSQAAAERLLSLAGFDFATLVDAARRPEFRPMETRVSVAWRVSNTVRPAEAVNVVGRIRGSNPSRRGEAVLFTAHYDGLGIRAPSAGDSIYNGAYENASGTALLLALAQAFARLSSRPARSVLFLALTGEEEGLQGSRYYVAHPLVPLDSTVAEVNFDGINLWGRTEDVIQIGRGLTSIDEAVQDAVEGEGLHLSRGDAPVRGALFESAQYSFLRAGVPAALLRGGQDYVGRPPGWGRQILDDFYATRYRTPSDEYRPDFDYGGAVQLGRVAFRLGLRLANDDSRPTWKGRAPFGDGRSSGARP